jgi:hypothetical protein
VLLLDLQQAHLPLICDSPAPDNKSSASSVTRIASPNQKFKKRSKTEAADLVLFHVCPAAPGGRKQRLKRGRKKKGGKKM